jgi:hypothetical protein
MGHIRAVFEPIVNRCTVVDMKEFARQMMEAFPQPAEIAKQKFVESAAKGRGENASFVDGWLETHKQNHEVSMGYLSELVDQLPESVITKFPMEDVKRCGYLGRLAARKLRLTNSSFRFIFVFAVLSLCVYFLQRRKGAAAGG